MKRRVRAPDPRCEWQACNRPALFVRFWQGSYAEDNPGGRLICKKHRKQYSHAPTPRLRLDPIIWVPDVPGLHVHLDVAFWVLAGSPERTWV